MTPSPAVTPPPGQPRFAGLDALRGFAILAVVLCHATGVTGAWNASWGWIFLQGQQGVVLFFMLSGFLIYRPFAAAHAAGGPRPALARYARRRVLRIVPAYWVALTVLSIWPGADGAFGHRWWVYYLFLQAYSQATLIGGLGITWSLCVEVSFYLLLPVLALLAARWAARRGDRPWWHGEVLVLVVFGLVGPVVLYIGNPLVSLSIGAIVLPGRWANTLLGVTDCFALGMLLAVLSVAAHARPGRARRAAGTAARHGGLLWLAAFAAWLVAARIQWVLGIHWGVLLAAQVLNSLAAALVLAPVALGATGTVERVTRWRPLMLLGVISYGIYLWHYVPVVWLGGLNPALAHGPHLYGRPHATLIVAPVILVVAIVVATASYRLVELPFLRRKEGGRGRPSAAEDIALSPP